MMLVAELYIKNYRSIKEQAFHLDPMSVLIGKNNVGKSNVLRALAFLLEGASRDVSPDDFFQKDQPIVIEARVTGISEFLSNLVPANQTKIRGRLTADGSMWIRRDATLDPSNTAEATKLKIGKQGNSEYELPTGMDAVLKAVLPEVIHIQVLDDPVEEASGKTTKPLGKLIGLILDAVQTQAQAGMQTAYREIATLVNVVTVDEDGVAKEVDNRIAEVREIEAALNRYVSEGFPRTRVRLNINFPDMKELLSKITVRVKEGGVENDLDFKGHGLQRFFYLALLQTLADKIRSATGASTFRPFILLFEEPELFLHPHAQRLMCKALRTISGRDQVSVATHSPLLITPDFLHEALILVKKVDSATSKTATHCLKPFSQPIPQPQTAERELLNLFNLQRSSTFLFADHVILVEGVGDLHLVTSMFLRLRGIHPSDCGLGVVEVEGKERLPKYKALLECTGLPISCITDLDFIWRGAGSVLQGNPALSQLCDALQRDAEPLVKEIGDEKKRGARRRELFTEFAKIKYAALRDQVCDLLREKGYFVLREGEIEEYVGLSEGSKTEYLTVARAIASGQRAINHEGEIKVIFDSFSPSLA